MIGTAPGKAPQWRRRPRRTDAPELVTVPSPSSNHCPDGHDHNCEFNPRIAKATAYLKKGEPSNKHEVAYDLAAP